MKETGFNKLFVWILLFQMTSFSCFSTIGQAGNNIQKTVYVAINGDDTNPGSLEQPLATLYAAQKAVRKCIKSGLKGDIHVLLHGGTHYLTRPLIFNYEDGGNHEFEVVYGAYPGETPILSGGRTITGWNKGQDDMWTTSLSDVKSGQWWFRQLYADGQRLSRGRYPEAGFLKIKKCADNFMDFQLDVSLPDVDLAGQNTEIIAIANWSIAREIVSANKADSVKTLTPLGWVGHGSCIPKPGQSVFFEHALEFVTQPGQWYLDHKNGTLYYKAAKDEDPNRKQFVAPILDQLLIVRGSKDNGVRNLHFRGLEFQHSQWNLPDIGYGGIQACYYGTTTGTSDEDQVTYSVTPAIEFEYTQDCSLNLCRIKHMGGNSVALGAGCRRNQIVGCEFTDIGANGPMVGYMKVRTPLHSDWKDPSDAPVNNEISNCYIHDCGIELYGAVGIFDAMANGTRIIHNELTRLPYGGISIGYVWNTEWTSQRNCLVAYNHVHNIMHRLYDSGAVYTLGYQPGSTIRANLLHGVTRSDYAFGHAANNGIFFDQGSKGILVEDNVIYDISEMPIRFNTSYTRWQTWRNNTFNITPSMPQFNKEIAKKAGLEPAYRKKLK